MKELRDTKVMFHAYLKAAKLDLNPDVLSHTGSNIKEMEKTLKSLEAFLKLLS